jgi:hypothetical protein
MSAFAELSREQLLQALEMFAKNWLAHDGCWFLAAEERLGMAAAVDLDARSWARFAAVEAKRIRTTFSLAPRGGLPTLGRALGLRMSALANEQHLEWLDDGKRLRLVMARCRVQDTRQRKGLQDFPCHSVGIIEFSTFACGIDPRIATGCVCCPPDSPPGSYCTWDFTMAGS